MLDLAYWSHVTVAEDHNYRNCTSHSFRVWLEKKHLVERIKDHVYLQGNFIF